MARQRPTSERGNSGTWLALLGLLTVSGALFFLAAMVAPQVFGILIVVMGFVYMIALHYVIWGRWLSKRLQPPAEEPLARPDDSDNRDV